MEIFKPKITQKPWGKEIWIAEEDDYAGKILIIKKGQRTSLHYHEEKKETMYLLEGRLKFTIKDKVINLNIGESITFSNGEMHRIEAIEDSKILEVSTSQLDDVVRVEDDYQRIEISNLSI